jgi:1,4-dihydroxy-2-naphthoate polyprenyltransferase
VFVGLIVMAVLALGYTVPPLKLSYRGLGEIGVALAMGIGVVLCGFVFQGADWRDPLPWLLGGVLSLAVVPSIVLAGVPDVAADQAVGKRTLAVRLGIRGASAVAAAATVLAVALLLIRGDGFGGGDWYAGSRLFIVLHALVTIAVIAAVAWRGVPQRIDLAMAVSLSYLVWFAAVPLFHLLR